MTNNWFKYLILIFSTSILTAGTDGQIRGKVENFEGEGLVGAQIYIETLGIGAVADLDGNYFIINVPVGKYDVQATMISYRTQVYSNVDVMMDNTIWLNFTLDVEAIEGDIIYVSGEKELVDKGATSKKITVGSEAIEALPIRDVSELYSLQSGVVKVEGGMRGGIPDHEEKGLEEVHVRGGRSGEIAYLIDGMYIRNPIYGGIGNGTRLNIFAVKEFDWQPGGFNAEYGDAMSAVSNMHTATGGNEFSYKFKYETSMVGAALGSHFDELRGYDDYNLGFGGTAPLFKKLKYWVSGQHTNYDNYRVYQFDSLTYDHSDPGNVINKQNEVQPWDDVDGASIIGNSGGDAESAGFFVSFYDYTVIGFSLTGALLPAGCGDLLTFSLEGEATGLSGIVVSDNNGNPITFSYYQGYEFDLVLDCSDEYPDCFYNYYDCLGECGGPVEIDECGICGGPGNVYCGGGIYECNQADCPDTFDYCLDLHEGANLISFYALPPDTSIDNVMSSLDGIVTGVIGEGVAASPNPVLGWVGSLNEISALSGYWVIVNAATSFCIYDVIPTDLSIVYDLHAGSNLISFPSEGSTEIGTALPDEIESFITGIIGEGVAASLNPVLGWVGSLEELSGGDGYWVITTNSISFSFEISSLNRIKTSNSIGLTNPHGFETIQSTQQAFYFIDKITSESADEFNDGWIISYYHGKVTGSRQWTGELIDIPVMGNDGNSYSQGYLHTGETPQFKYLDNTTGKLTDLYHGDIPQWENNGIYILGSMDVKEILPQEIMLSTYPNPFNPTTTLSFTVQNEGMLQLSIYNISGQLVSELAHEYRTSGNVEYIWDAAKHPSGVYFAQLNINGTFYTQKLVLMK